MTNIIDDNIYNNNVLNNNYDEKEASSMKKDNSKDLGKIYQWEIKWFNVVFLTVLHAAWIYSLLHFPYVKKYKTTLWMCLTVILTGFGVSGGIHRLWSHRSYKVKKPLNAIMALCYIASLQNRIYDWVRDHRVHHKYSETDADPHNSLRGFFYAHIGWLMVKKQPEVYAKGQQIDMSDIKNDPILAFYDKYFHTIRFAVTLILIAIPVYLWNEDWYYSTMAQHIRFLYVTNATWSLNSFCHMHGLKPYDKNIAPVESRAVNVWTYGEGWHNYHHTFPSDYSGPEINFVGYDLTRCVIDSFAKMGWVYDRKISSESLVNMTIDKRGDKLLVDSLKKSSTRSNIQKPQAN